jgi:mono/diheme cytochrome c family protein
MRRQGDPVNGRYLVEKVGLCIDCHSPRDERGQFVRERWLQGAPIPFTPAVPMPWAPVSKPLAGLPTLTDEQAMTFLTTGVLPDGRMPLPPMPPYRLSVDDARDVIAYLRHPVLPDAEPPAAAAGQAR